MRGLLVAFESVGYTLRPVSAMSADVVGQSVFVRHDIDLHLFGIAPVATLEANLGLSATYYIALTQPYNPAHSSNVAVIRSLVAQGHEIGLHYDLDLYPRQPEDALRRLNHERAVLEEIAEVAVRTISTHQPYKGLPDPFLSLDGLIHPHDSRRPDPFYVSDSCRAWRDESLLTCFSSNPPKTVLLNTHPELWLGRADTDRDAYLTQTVVPNALAPTVAFFEEVVRPVWATYPGAKAHDRRQPHDEP